MMPWKQRLLPRNWAIRWVVAAAPTASAIVVIAIVFIGIKLAEQQLDRIQDQAERSLAYQEMVLELPRMLEAAHTDLYKLTILRRLGVVGEQLDATRRSISFRFQAVDHLQQQLDPRVESTGLALTIDNLRRAVDQAVILIDRSPSLGAVAVRGAERNFRETETIAEIMSSQAAMMVLQDIQEARDASAKLAWTFFVVLIVVGLLLACASLGAAQIIARPILGLAHVVEALQKGKRNVHVPATDRQDQIGKVALAIKSFQASLKQNQRLQRERDDLNRNLERKVIERTRELAIQKERLSDAQRIAEAQREEMTAELRSEFGKVIQAASAGDFEKRVTTTFSDRNLQALANDINSFVKRVDSSVAAVGEAMRAMAHGDLAPTGNHEFTGAFAQIMTRIDETGAQIRDQAGQLTHIALHDALTGLPNRRFLEDRLADYTKLLAHSDLGVAVLHIDLDRFKEINDTMGHAAGDAVLVKAARVLEDLADNDDFVARVGGDEFMMLCPLLDTDAYGDEHDRIKALGSRIVDQLSEPIMIDGQEARFGASVGIAFSRPDMAGLSGLVVDADIALYQAKEAGRNQAQVFSTSAASAMTQRRALRDDLFNALELDQFVPFFQPKYDANTNALVGVEALVRWQHPEKGILTPDAFLGAANDLDLVKDIDKRILWQSAEILTDLNENYGFQIPELSVNVSQQRLYDSDLLSSIDGLNASFNISFELLESIFFDDQDDRFYWMLDALRERNISIQIDDFGSGRASISALVNINPDRLKIDKSLVRPLAEVGSSSQLIKGIVDIANSMNIRVTAEGVETIAQAKLLRTLGCDTLQGYAFSKPMPKEELTRFCLKDAS